MIDIIVPPVVQLVPLRGLNEETRKPYTTDNQIVKKTVQVQVGPPTGPFLTEGFFSLPIQTAHLGVLRILTAIQRRIFGKTRFRAAY